MHTYQRALTMILMMVCCTLVGYSIGIRANVQNPNRPFGLKLWQPDPAYYPPTGDRDCHGQEITKLFLVDTSIRPAVLLHRFPQHADKVQVPDVF